MAATQIADIDAILKKIFQGNDVQSLVQKMTPLLDEIKPNVGVNIANNKIYISSRYTQHSGTYFVPEGTEPKAGDAKYIAPYASMMYQFGTVNFSDQAVEATNGDQKAVKNLVKDQIKAAMDTAARENNRVMHGSGTGKLCLANGAGVGSVTVTVDGCPSEPNSGSHTKYIFPGGYVKIGTNDNCQVVSVDSDTQFTIDAVKTWSDNDVITRAGFSSSEPMGLAGIIDNGDNVATFQGYARGSYPILNSYIDKVAESLTEAKMITGLLQARKWGSKFNIKGGGDHMIFMGLTMYQAYGSLLLSMKRNTTPQPVLSGGFMGLEFMDGVPVICDDDTWEGYVQGLNKKAVTIAQMSEAMKWLPGYGNGGILVRSASNRTVWEGTFKWYYNFIALQNRPNFGLRAKTA
jgi:hypothetical protein